ncbi:unannotated protein [freshwater metagenome]|uniref:Unannotated protein n=1 Tax=freshwater metagenome TaxID=449393 RepID=A0A6J7AVJ5_9ZZZZ
MTNRPTADVRLGDLRHVDRALYPRRLPELFEGVLQRQCIDHRGEHAHVVGLGAIHARAGTGHATPDVAPADHHGDVDREGLAQLDNVLGDLADHNAVDARARGSGESLTRELENDATPPPRHEAGDDGFDDAFFLGHQEPMVA